MEAQRGQTAELARQYLNLRTQYGVKEPRSELARLEQAMNRRRFRIQHLRSQLAEIQEQLRWLETELDGFDKGMELVLTEAIEDLLQQHREMWSPFPALGFRMWTVDSDGFHGVKLTWSTPTMEARCLTTGERDGVPHTDGSCRYPPCGIYATKTVEYLLSDGLPKGPVAVGLVEMSGKVVEHTRGYRAQRATIRALVLNHRNGNLLCTDEPAVINELLRDPSRSLTLAATTTTSDVTTASIEYLQSRARRMTWTSEKKNE